MSNGYKLIQDGSGYRLLDEAQGMVVYNGNVNRIEWDFGNFLVVSNPSNGVIRISFKDSNVPDVSGLVLSGVAGSAGPQGIRSASRCCELEADYISV